MEKSFFNLNYGEADDGLYQKRQIFNYIKTIIILLAIIILGSIYMFFPEKDDLKIMISESVMDTTINQTIPEDKASNKSSGIINIEETAKKATNKENKTNLENRESVESAETTKSRSSSKKLIVNINTAPSKELEKINGIGVSLAKNIIDYRTKNGGFAHKEEIKNVKGVGDKLYEKIKDYITAD